MSGQASGEAANRADDPLGQNTGGWDILLLLLNSDEVI